MAPNHPALMRFKAKRCATLDEVRCLGGRKKSRRARTNTDEQGQSVGARSSVSVGVGPCGPLSTPTLVANAALSLLNLACYLLDRQLASQAAAFEKEGGFTERLYRVRSAAKKGKP